MTSDWIVDVSEYLSELDIDHDISETTLLLNRESIVNRIPSKCKNDAYNKLLLILNGRFQSRFSFISKSTDGFELDRTGTED